MFFAHFEASVAIRSADRRSHDKEHSSRYLCSALLLTSNETLRLGQLIEDHMAKKHSSRYLCSFLLLTSKENLRLGLLIEDHMAQKHS